MIARTAIVLTAIWLVNAAQARPPRLDFALFGRRRAVRIDRLRSVVRSTAFIVLCAAVVRVPLAVASDGPGHVDTHAAASAEPARTLVMSEADIAGYLLEPLHTSGPRELIVDFYDRVERMHEIYQAVLASYQASDRLYLSAQERLALLQFRALSDVIAGGMAFDQLPQAFQTLEYRQRMILTMKEVLDHVGLPPLASIPDGKEAAADGRNRWRVPGTEIELQRVGEGDREGQWRVTAATIMALPDMVERAAGLPYRDTRTQGFLKAYREGVLGLRWIVPIRWLQALPQWSHAPLAQQPLWRWLGLTMLLGISAVVLVRIRRLASWLAHRSSVETRIGLWSTVIVPLSVVLVIVLVRDVSAHNLRFTAPVYVPMMVTLAVLFYLSTIWLIWSVSRALSESIILSRKLRKWSIDGQLIRLGLRLVAIVLSTVLFIEGANRIGLPAYSLVAGLGVGGIAVAFAARESLANLIGSFTIMIEKPFRVGHWIRVGDTEGTVEAVGFRSTTIRTFHDSLVSVPSTRIVDSTIDNMGARTYRRFRTTLSIPYDTPPDRVLEFVAAIREIIATHPDTRKSDYHVRVLDFAESGLEILLYIFFDVASWEAELRAREDAIVRILRCAETLGVTFALPARNVTITS